MKVAILYICTGKYEIFWRDFYLSCETYFLPGIEKHYFVFTDSGHIDFEQDNPRIHRIYQENLGWPGNTLRRYEIFLSIEKNLEQFDYLFYLNANLLFLLPVMASNFLPQGNENLVACLHPGYYNKKRRRFTYEKNPRSLAYIDRTKGLYYFAGGINGGRTAYFIDAMKVMRKNIADDLSRGIVAVWHDESHWNKYLLDRSDVKMLHPGYLYPEGFKLPYEKIILIRDKARYGGHNRIRGERPSFFKKFKRVLVKIKNRLSL